MVHEIMEILLVLLLGLSGLVGVSAVNPCLDPTSTDYECETDGQLSLKYCDLTNEDVDDIASCMDAYGRGDIQDLYLNSNDLTTLPEAFFEGLTSLSTLSLASNDFTTLPEALFEGLTTLNRLYLSLNTLTTLPEALFEGLTDLTRLSLAGNNLTTLPEGLLLDQTDLELLRLDGNSLECLPTVPSIFVDLDDDASDWADGLHVDPYGDECGCSIPDVTDNVCGELTCTPGELGYTCEATLAPVPAPTESPVPATLAPMPAPTQAPAPEPSFEEGTPAPGAPAPGTPAPGTPAPRTPAPGTPTPGTPAQGTPTPETAAPVFISSPEGASDTSPMIAGVVSAIAGAGLIVVGLWLKRRHDGRKSSDASQPRTTTSRDLEHDPGFGPKTGTGTVVIRGDGGHRPRQDRGPLRPPDAHPPAAAKESDNQGPVSTSNATSVPIPGTAAAAAPELAPAPASALEAADLPQVLPSNLEQEETYGKDSGHTLRSGGAINPAADQSLTATMTTANMSTAERAELSHFNQRVASSSASSVDESTQADTEGDGLASSASGRRVPQISIGLGEAVMEAAENLAYHCQFPGVSEAAAVVSTLAKLVLDSRDIKSGGDANLRKCRLIIRMLERASTVAGTGSETTTAEQRELIDEVHFQVQNLVDLIKTYQSKNKLAKVLMATSFKRRQEDLEVAIDRALDRLQFGLHVKVANDVSAVKEGMDSYQGSTALARWESLAEARRARRQRKLDQVEIPANEVVIFEEELLGKGGFGEVFVAEYNKRIAAAKVIYIAHDLGKDDVLEARSGDHSNPEREKTSQRKAFLRELNAMIRLRSPHTVNVYGAITSRSDRLVLVMELLAFDLRTMLKQSKEPLPEEQSRRLVGDICAGMAFLHGRETVHGDLKSANVLLDGNGRAKIGDFGTSRWSHHTNSTNLATFTKGGQNTQFSLAWSAPEVLNASGSTFASDVYSFGIVAWEVLSRELPWENLPRPQDVIIRVLTKHRPEIPVDAPADLANMIRACWAGNPGARPTFSTIMERIESNGWSE